MPSNDSAIKNRNNHNDNYTINSTMCEQRLFYVSNETTQRLDSLNTMVKYIEITGYDRAFKCGYVIQIGSGKVLPIKAVCLSSIIRTHLDTLKEMFNNCHWYLKRSWTKCLYYNHSNYSFGENNQCLSQTSTESVKFHIWRVKERGNGAICMTDTTLTVLPVKTV